MQNGHYFFHCERSKEPLVALEPQVAERWASRCLSWMNLSDLLLLIMWLFLWSYTLTCSLSASAAVRSGGVHPVSAGARGLSVARRLSGSHRHPPGCRARTRLLAERASEHRLLRVALSAPTKRPRRVHTSALGLLLRLVTERHPLLEDGWFLWLTVRN